jgi:PRTRC genetic system ThiF family protein
MKEREKPMSEEEKRKKHFIAPDIQKITIVGVGGTGGYLAQGLAKMIAGYRLNVEVTLVDPDVIEEKNRFRQNFMPWEIGENKAEALAFRLNQQYGLAFKAFSGTGENYYANARTQYRELLITCVDKIAPRKKLSHHPLWLDCGNDLDFGQVIFGTTHDSRTLKNQFETWDKTPNITGLPNAYRKANMGRLRDKKSSTASCADHPFSEQGCFINELSAQAGLMILHQLLVKGVVETPAIYFDSSKGRMLPAKINKQYFDI